MVCCCDINNTDQQLYADHGVEFYFVLDKLNTQKFAAKMGLRKANYSDEQFLKKIQEHYGGQEDCFLDLKSFFNSKNIDYQFSRW